MFSKIKEAASKIDSKIAYLQTQLSGECSETNDSETDKVLETLKELENTYSTLDEAYKDTNLEALFSYEKYQKSLDIMSEDIQKTSDDLNKLKIKLGIIANETSEEDRPDITSDFDKVQKLLAKLDEHLN